MRLTTLRPSLTLALAAGLAVVVYVSVQNWSGSPVTLDAVGAATIVGVSIGSLYAVSAAGLVVVYTTTGVFNFAHGGIGVFSAFVYWELVENTDGPGLPNWLGLVVVVLLVAPLLGVGLDILIMRRLRTAPLVVQLMVTVGLMVFFLTLTGQIWEANRARSVSFFWPGEGFDIGDFRVTWHRFAMIVIALVIAVFLRMLLFQTRIGVAMRAVVDNRELTALNGARPNAVSSFAWALGASLAALAGILIAPEVEFNPANLNDIMLIVAIAAAAFGQLRSLPLTVVGALLIGLLQAYNRQWLSYGGDWRFVDDAIAPIVLFLVVLALPQSRLDVGRVAHNLRPIERTTRWWEGTIGAVAIVAAAVVLANGWLNFGFWDPGAWNQIALNNGIAALTLALIGISLVPLTGWAGQVNFAPLAFAGFGAYLFFHLAGESGNALWIPVVGLLCAPLGALVALFAARLSGIYLGLLSLAFALLMGKLFFPHPRVFPPKQGGQFTNLELFGRDFDERKHYFILLAAVFGVAMLVLIVLRRSRFGRRWVAMRDSQAAAATVGVNVVWTKIVVYATSAAIAGMGGVFWAISKTSIDSVRDFDVLVNFEIVLLMAAAGMAFPVAGLFLSFRFVVEALGAKLDDVGNLDFLVWLLRDFLANFGPGLLAIGMVVNQRGAIYEMGKGFAPLLPWRADAREEQADERASKRVPEIGELGLHRPFTSEDVVELDHRLGIVDDITPPTGYRHGTDPAEVSRV
ncbi:MAG: ABC transporter permease [Acidimicrobiia bacterium]|nr:ABC transporter permease [Acidimicrobiia bacterium]MDH5237113.1 ABC transporter permease [Acidimicrobiia bacterium]